MSEDIVALAAMVVLWAKVVAVLGWFILKGCELTDKEAKP